MDEPGNGGPEHGNGADPGADPGAGSTEPPPASGAAGYGGTGAGRDDEPDRDSLERLFALVGPRVDEVRSLLGDSTSRWRGDALRVGEGTRQRLKDLFHELGLVTRDDWDELELRVAQLEHRLGLLERRADETP
jgi:hypothetical protein